MGIDSPDLSLLRECFNQRGIETILVPPETFAQRLSSQKFEAAILKLDQGAEALLKTLRASPLNRHGVVYAIADTFEEAESLFKHGVNAVLLKPLDREAVLETVEATHRLLSGELRRYPRVPLATAVEIICEGEKDRGTTSEISGGGMSLKTKLQVAAGQKMDLSFRLPGTAPIALTGVVLWRQGDKVGVRFDRLASREVVRDWLYEYLEIT